MILMRRDFLLSGTLAAAAMTSIGPLMAQSTGPAMPAQSRSMRPATAA